MKQIQKCLKALSDTFRPPAKLTLSEWADKYAVLSAESSAEVGRWRTLPYQKGIMDAITDPGIERVSVKKSARVGYTKILNHALCYYIHQDPCSIMVVQPTIEDAEGYSKEEIAPMLRDTPVLKGLVTDSKQRDGTNSILHKVVAGGGLLSLVGANSPRGFRRVSRRVVALDETSAYPKSSGKEGTPIKLAIKRTEYFWNRKIIDGSTPGNEGECAITTAFEEGDQRYRFLPCPQCGHMQPLKWENLKFNKADPSDAHFVCEENGCVIEHKHLRWMDERGEWRPTAKPRKKGHASFHIWAAYSYSPNSTWADIASEFLACKDDQEDLKTFVNTVLGETWRVKGEAPDHMRLFERREHYEENTCPKGVVFLTAGADVQKDRIEVSIYGWGRRKESWLIDHRVLPGNTNTDVPWKQLDEILNETWTLDNKVEVQLKVLAVDSSAYTQEVYSWVRSKNLPNRVLAIKGVDDLQSILGSPTYVDVNHNGIKLKKGLRLWKVGTNKLKEELYGFLNLPGAGDDGVFPTGYCHYSRNRDEHFFKMLTAEQLIVSNKKHTWVEKYHRNEALDCRNYARAAAAFVGIDRFKEQDWLNFEAIREVELETQEESKPAPKPLIKSQQNNFWNNRGRKGFW